MFTRPSDSSHSFVKGILATEFLNSDQACHQELSASGDPQSKCKQSKILDYQELNQAGKLALLKNQQVK